MCGICGVLNFNGQAVSKSSIYGMMKTMKHRGPDDEGIVLDGSVGLGFVRLSILDLSVAGRQPMYSKNQRYIIVYNGEVYNYIELRADLAARGHCFSTTTDTEVVIAAYEEWGEECLSRFNGMWGLVIYDKYKKTIFGARDRYGIKPFYYVKTNDYFAFCSEITPLLSLLRDKPTPDYQSIFDYLVFNRTDQTERTFFKEIKKLQHGHSFYLNIRETCHKNLFCSRSRTLSCKQWYRLQDRVFETTGFTRPEEFKEMLSSSVALRLRSDVPVGVCLSGGLDSSSIVSIILNDFNKYDLFTFSAVYEKDQHGDETEFINLYRDKLQNMRFTTPTAQSLDKDLYDFVRAHAEPIPSTAPYAQFKVMELARENIVVTLDGQGADEELAGYHYFFGFFFKDLLKKGRIDRLCLEILLYLLKHKSMFGVKTFLYFMLPEHIRTKARLMYNSYIKKDFAIEYQDHNVISEQLYGSETLQQALLNHFEYKLEHLLKWEDRNSMWHSLEARVPFLDYRLVEKILATSGDMIIRKGMTKHLLREAMLNVLPEKIRLREDKIGFETPQDEWFRTDRWNEKINEILNSDSFKHRGIIDREVSILKYEHHKAGKINIANEIWKWVHLELWFQNFID